MKNITWKKRCIIHYKRFPKYSKLKEVRETSKESQEKEERKILGGEQQHKDQYDGIPDFTVILAG